MLKASPALSMKFFVPWMWLLLAFAPGAALACGGNGERACCITDGGNACGGGLIQTGNCVNELGGGACTCGGFNPFGLTKAIGVCRAPTCGGNGQRGCCVGAERDVKGLSDPSRPCAGAGIEVGSCVDRLGAGSCHCLTGFDSSGVCVVPTGCGGNGARACCFVERPGDPCNDGTVEVGGCADGRDDCLCAPGVWAQGRCADPVCGGHGERGCCLLGEERATQGLFGPCEGGLVEYGACQGDCACRGGVGGSSSGRCYRPTACGGEGQRACCVGEGAACQPGLVESGGPLAAALGLSSDCESELGGPACLCSSGLLSGGICTRPQCGRNGERACCVGAEREQRGIAGACEPGLREDLVNGCQGDCACGSGLGNSISMCRRETPCGGADQRACCIGVGEFAPNPQQTPSCSGNLIEVPGCNGPDCTCGGAGVGQRSSGMCRQNSAPTPCGGPNERACCAGTFEVVLGMACDQGLVELPGCSGEGCACGGWNPLGIQASGICAAPTACGGAGQRACCTPFLEFAPGGLACAAGLTAIPGCSGDCFCGGIATGQSSLETCAVANPGLGSMAEPGTGWSAPAAAPASALRGYADMHLHLFADTAHGGGVLAGRSWDPAGVNVALQQDFGTNLNLVSKSGQPLPRPNCPPYLPNCGSKVFHQDHIIGQDTVGFSSNDGTDSNLGAPLFNGWPRWSNVTHQQAYYKWLERAWRGGLRMTSMLAVSNEAMCGGNSRMAGVDCTDSMPAIDEQLDAAYAFEDWLDSQSGGPGRGWFRIVTTPAEARRVITEGKLAVILGIEVDNLFGCKADRPFDAKCGWNHMDTELDRYYAMGVRHIFPVHNFNNGYGATATWMDAINVGNNYSEGHYYTAEECSNEGYGFRLTSFLAAAINLAGFGGMALPLVFPPYESLTATCNQRALTELGRHLLQRMMERGMLIDVDHMGRKALDETLSLASNFSVPPAQDAERCGGFDQCSSGVCCWQGAKAGTCQPTQSDCDAAGYPVIASHVLMFDLYQPGARTERMRTRAQLERIKALGGMIAPITEMRDANDDNQRVSAQYGHVANDCLKSTKTFAQVLEYAVDVMGAPVGIGTDFNGIAFHLSPRFGSEACARNAADRSTQYRRGARLAYPFALDAFGSFAKQVSGLKTFDYNVDGLAHVGLLPDFVKDLETVGTPAATLEQFWRSAQGFVEVWERATGGSAVLPPLRCGQFIEIPADEHCQATAAVVLRALAPDARYSTGPLAPAGPFPLGFTEVSTTVAGGDACAEGGPIDDGGGVFCASQISVVDRTGPVLACPADIVAPFVGNVGGGVQLTRVPLPALQAVDACRAEPYQVWCDYSVDEQFFFPLGTTVNHCVTGDEQNNRSTCQYNVVVQKTGPRLQIPPNVTVECLAPTTPAATGTAVATPYYGAATVTYSDVFEPGCGRTGRILRTWTGTQNDDRALSTSATQVITIRDSIPPTLDVPADRALRADQDSTPAGTGVPAVADACGDVRAPGFSDAIQELPDGSRIITRSWTVADACGLQTSGSQRITVGADLCPLDQRKIEPGQCGCGATDVDADGDSVADCLDGCPNDPNKIARLVNGCPCGVFDTDTDGDATPDCNDRCPNDAAKTAPGLCGCGTADVDSDGDGTADCNELCPADPAKTAPGLCGCGRRDDQLTCPAGTTLYGAAVGGFCCEGVTDGNVCNGAICALDPARAQGHPLCAVQACEVCPPNGGNGADADGDGVPNCRDLCSNDALKAAPGICGCGTPDTDRDGDATPDCNDACPANPAKTSAGVCGCASLDADTDGDGTLDCADGCPNDRNKVVAGTCGCGVSETDSDADGTPDCTDGCPNHGLKTDPGVCGCPTPETDTDGDGTLDCEDLCRFDPAKIAPGRCGCANPDDDSGCPAGATLYGQAVGGFCCAGATQGDTCDGTVCALDPARTQGNPICPPVACEACPPVGGGGLDTDGDGTPDCRDLCPNTAPKSEPGVCGCETPDTDSDADTTPDCLDLCPNDAGKTEPGRCGCAVADRDADADGVLDCDDGCPNDTTKVAPGPCGCGVADDDDDGDGTANCDDLCPADVAKVEPGHCGCALSDLDGDADGTPDCDDLCPNDAPKTAPGLCGCATADDDADSDGSPNCMDRCVFDPHKVNPGVCGCGLPDVDRDGNGAIDACDLCEQVGDTDLDADGVCDAADNCGGLFNPGQEDTDLDGLGDGCDQPELPPDAGVLPADARVLPEDAQVPPADARVLPADAHVLPADARVLPGDAGVDPRADSGLPVPDLGVSPADLGLPPGDQGALPGDGASKPTDGGTAADGGGGDGGGGATGGGGAATGGGSGGSGATGGMAGGGHGAGAATGAGGERDDETDGAAGGESTGSGDAGPAKKGSGSAAGCACRQGRSPDPRAAWTLLFLLAGLRMRRRRR